MCCSFPDPYYALPPRHVCQINPRVRAKLVCVDETFSQRLESLHDCAKLRQKPEFWCNRVVQVITWLRERTWANPFPGLASVHSLDGGVTEALFILSRLSEWVLPLSELAQALLRRACAAYNGWGQCISQHSVKGLDRPKRRVNSSSAYYHSLSVWFNSCLGSRLEVMRETRARSDAGSRAFHATSPNDCRDKSYRDFGLHLSKERH